MYNTRQGRTPLQLALGCNANYEILKLLLKSQLIIPSRENSARETRYMICMMIETRRAFDDDVEVLKMFDDVFAIPSLQYLCKIVIRTSLGSAYLDKIPLLELPLQICDQITNDILLID